MSTGNDEYLSVLNLIVDSSWLLKDYFVQNNTSWDRARSFCLKEGLVLPVLPAADRLESTLVNPPPTPTLPPPSPPPPPSRV